MDPLTLGIGALIALGSGIYGKWQSDKQIGEMNKIQRETDKKQQELLKAKGPEATQSNETYDALRSKRAEMFKRGLMSTIKTSNFGLLDTVGAGVSATKTKLGQ